METFVKTETTLYQVTDRKENGKYLCIDLTDMSEEWLSEGIIHAMAVSESDDIEDLFDLAFIVRPQTDLTPKYETVDYGVARHFRRNYFTDRVIKAYANIFTNEGIKTVAEYKNGGWVRKDQVELW